MRYSIASGMVWTITDGAGAMHGLRAMREATRGHLQATADKPRIAAAPKSPRKRVKHKRKTA
jgi:hypothetical protein